MLLQLRVKAIGIIEDISWDLGPGLNVITGETGVGKSLVIDAVEALLAGKVDEELVRYGADKAYLEGVFILPTDSSISQLKELLGEKGIETEDYSLVISCELRRQGRGTIRVNGYAVPRGLLNRVGDLLVDIHGQSEHLSLLDKSHHGYLLDSYGHTLDLCRQFSVRAAQLHKVEEELKALTEEENEQEHRKDFLSFQLDEIRRAELRDGEDEELERERNILSSSEKLKALSLEAYQKLHGEQIGGHPSSAFDSLNEALQLLRKLVGLDPSLKHQTESLEESVYSLEEAARDILSYSDRMEYDPMRMEAIETRLELIRSLKRKYGQTTNEILAYLDNGEREMEKISHHGEKKTRLTEECKSIREDLGKLASELSQKRQQAAEHLTAGVDKELKELNMAQVKFEISFARTEAEEGIPFPDEKTYNYSNKGADEVEFVAATNPGEPLKPLAKIASTGEISRFALALKSALAGADNIPVLIFDEIDIGVGGRSGEVIGKKLWNLARERQVICVTHLPQIAAYADSHYNVYKNFAGSRTLSRLNAIDGESRLREIAAMLAGPNYSETSLEDAREMIERAELWKETALM